MSTTEQRVTFGCHGTCGEHYPREALKVAQGGVFCASCYPRALPAKNVKTPHVRGPKPEWRRK